MTQILTQLWLRLDGAREKEIKRKAFIRGKDKG